MQRFPIDQRTIVVKNDRQNVLGNRKHVLHLLSEWPVRRVRFVRVRFERPVSIMKKYGVERQIVQQSSYNAPPERWRRLV